MLGVVWFETSVAATVRRLLLALASAMAFS
jgi:hypothetical protein